MDRYFEDMLPAEELEQLKFIPTIPEFVTWVEQKWHDLPALSDTVSTCTYAKMCNDIAPAASVRPDDPASYGRVRRSRMGRSGEFFQECPCTGECHSAFNSQNSQAYSP